MELPQQQRRARCRRICWIGVGRKSVAGKSVLAIDHDRGLLRVGPSRNTLSPNHGLYTESIFSLGFVKHRSL
jgi:hypothetical protein